MTNIKLGDLCKSCAGQIKVEDGELIDYIDISSIDNEKKKLIGFQTMPFGESPSRARKVVKKGSILVSTVRPNLNAIAVLENDTPNISVASTGFCILDCKDDVDNRFVFNFCKSRKFIDDMVSKATGASYPAVSDKIIRSALVPNYTYEEQCNISKVLDSISDIIDKREAELFSLDELIKARFVEMFGCIHDGRFDMKTLLEIVNDDKNSIKRGPFGGALKKEDFVEDGYLVYEQRHAIHNDFEYAKYYINQEKYEDMIGFKVIPGDLIISCSGVTLGRIAEVPEGAKEGIINQALLKLSLNPHIMMNTFFIQQFRGEEIQNILFGFSRGSGIPNMPSMSEVKAVKFICPPLELQKEYCDFVHQVDKSKFMKSF